MATFNPVKNSLNFKVVYFGAAASGKTTTLRAIANETLPEEHSMALLTPYVPSLFFEFVPVSLGQIASNQLCVQLYSYPHHQLWPTVNAHLCHGIDAAVFVVDSRMDQFHENDRALRQFMEGLSTNKNSIYQLPLVIQCNHQDANNAISLQTFSEKYENLQGHVIASTATQSTGVLDGFSWVTEKLLSRAQTILENNLETPLH